jgi:hypothetical protein
LAGRSGAGPISCSRVWRTSPRSDAVYVSDPATVAATITSAIDRV